MEKIKLRRNLLIITLILTVSTLVVVTYVAEGSSEESSLINADLLAKEIELDFRGVDLRDAFSALADVAGVNIVTDGSVSGETTLRLRELNFFQALELMTRTNDLIYKVVDNSVVISTPERMKTLFAEQRTRVFELNSAEPEELSSTLNLIVNDGEIRVDERTKSLIITAYEEELRTIDSLIQNLDRRQAQIALEVRIEEFSHSSLREIGMDLSLDNLTSLDYIDALELIESQGESSILARPQISTIDGETATIMIGDSIPIFNYFIDDEGRRRSEPVRYEDVGIDLEITPRITRDNQIMVEVIPEITAVIEYRTDNVSGNQHPVFSTRKVETNIRVADGETVVLGGLIRDEEHENIRKIPILGDIPLLGRLFRRSSTESDKTELVIFMTPRVIDQGEALIVEELEEEGRSQWFEVQSLREYSSEEQEEELIEEEEELIEQEKELIEQEEEQEDSEVQLEDSSEEEDQTEVEELELEEEQFFIDNSLNRVLNDGKAYYYEDDYYLVLQGPFESYQKTLTMVAELKELGYAPYIIYHNYYLIQLDSFELEEDAQSLGQELEEQGFDYFIYLLKQ